MFKTVLLAATLLSSVAMAQVVPGTSDNFGLAWHDGNLWTTNSSNELQSTLTIVDPKTDQVLKTLNIPLGATDLSFSKNGKFAYFAREGEGSFSILNTKTFDIKTIDVPGNTAVLAVEKGKLYVTGKSNVTILTEGGKKIGNIVIPGADAVRGLSFNKNGSKMVAASENTDTISIIDLKTHKILHTVAVGDQPRSTAVMGKFAYSANWTGNDISKVNIKTGKLVDTFSTGDYPRRVLAHGKELFVANQGSNTVSVVKHDKVVQTFNTSFQQPMRLAYHHGNLFVGGAVTQDIEKFHLTSPGHKGKVSFGGHSNVVHGANIDVMFQLLEIKF